MKKVLAFAALEFVTVILLGAMLVAFAVPAYRTTMVKARVGEMMAKVEPLKLQMVTSIAAGRKPKVVVLKNNSEYISSLAILPSKDRRQAKLELVADNKRLGIPIEEPLIITLTASMHAGVITWQCDVDENYRTYMPAFCDKF